MLQFALNGKQTNEELLTVLHEVSKVKSMALLLRTVVAANVQGLVKPSLSGRQRYVLRLLSQCTAVLIRQN